MQLFFDSFVQWFICYVVCDSLIDIISQNISLSIFISNMFQKSFFAEHLWTTALNWSSNLVTLRVTLKLNKYIIIFFKAATIIMCDSLKIIKNTFFCCADISQPFR